MPNEAPPPARLLIADDHALVRDGLRAILRSDPGFEVVGEADNGQKALELCRELSPDLVLMDVRMPKMDGLEATRRIKRELPRTIVLVITASEDPTSLSEALKAGASGYILKEASGREVIGAVQRALEGESPLNQEVAMELLKRLLDQTRGEEEPTIVAPGRSSEKQRLGAALPVGLTPREVEVLRLVARGQTNRQIAKEMLISTSAAKDYVGRLIDKLEVSDRTQAAVRAVELGLLRKEEKPRQ